MEEGIGFGEKGGDLRLGEVVRDYEVAILVEGRELGGSQGGHG